MSALARYFLSENYEVFGSDIGNSAITDSLEKEGVIFFNEQKSENITENNFDLFVYTEAIPDTNPELKTAIEKKIEIKNILK